MISSRTVHIHICMHMCTWLLDDLHAKVVNCCGIVRTRRTT